MQYKVLIIEDDPMVAMINEQYVCKNSQFCVAASCRNGQEALDYLESNSVDLIVLDVFMPYMDGIETLKKIREKKIASEVIMVTAANDSTTIEETMHLGVIDYLIKPFAYERFQVALEKFAANRKYFKQNATFDQSSIDNIISKSAFTPVSANYGIALSDDALLSPAEKSDSAVINQKDLPKGIQKKTLCHIQDYLKTNTGWQTVEMLSEKLGISIVTARHYLNYLEQQGIIKADVNYSTGGRPSMLYKIC
ncbi:response regulator [Treponema sp.]|uniref:response regulator n=1 Tax=Treponema sp. TaxID=166 RepID=UPI00298EB942|nr:response regulator [Treponema sp.]MCR5613301.1 response regulator [Treponema sp.]